ncbi:putative linker histone H1/H5, domain H15, winged helix-like DNA-binding domain superfamily [Helianthus annuus]|nr:putative linker histone H1/H5, domain H15, winged helix-like DNA-binding domain superfamily [Helianthus annuus]KAJ0648309.1 putative linker histone H1/H5, domain H15, winged helix-like DNA-binding domain superfamily [Helianthus annuus]
MEKLQEALIQFTHSNPNLFPNDANNSYPLLIQHCFPKFFSDFQTPNHPPYAAMIYKAIQELNKKGGSSEKSISDHIQKEYTDLPWAHSTLLKHHLEKLCDRNEICITDKQCYLLAGIESESRNKSSKPSKKHKKDKSQPNSEACKKSSRPSKKYKKKEKNPSGVQKTSAKEHIELLKRKRKLGLKSIKKNSKRAKKRLINNEVTVDESHEQKQTSEITMGDIQIQERNGLRKRKRKHGLKSKRKSSKHTKKHAINEDTELQLLGEANLEQNNEVIDDVSAEQNQIVEVNMGDIQIQEQNEAGQVSDRDNSGYVNLEQTQTKKNPELLQIEESPGSNPVLHGNGKRVWTRSQWKTVLKKDALGGSSELTDSLGYANMSKDKPDIVEYLSNEKQQAMEIIEVKSAVDIEPLQISRSTSLDKPLIEFSPKKLIIQFSDNEPTTAPSSTEAQDSISSQQDQQTEKLPLDDKPMYKRRGRRPKPMESEKSTVKGQQSDKKLIPEFPADEPTTAPSSIEVQDPIGSQQDQQLEKVPLDDKPKHKRRGRPPKRMQREKSKFKSQQLAKKCKAGKKKGQPKNKGHVKHKMTRRSSREPS